MNLEQYIAAIPGTVNIISFADKPILIRYIEQKNKKTWKKDGVAIFKYEIKIKGGWCSPKDAESYLKQYIKNNFFGLPDYWDVNYNDWDEECRPGMHISSIPERYFMKLLNEEIITPFDFALFRQEQTWYEKNSHLYE